MKATALRANLYQLLDEVLATGKALVIERHGQRLRIVPEQPPSKLARLSRRESAITGSADDLVHLDWSKDWAKGRDL